MKNLKKILSILLVAGLVMSLFACGSKNASAPKTFTVGFDAEYPPYGYLAKDGNYTGFDLELAEEFCKRKGYVLKKQPIDWEVKDAELVAGNIDCIWNGFTIEGRENDYTWSFPYVDNSIVLVVKADSGIKNKTDLSGKNVLVQAGSSGLAALESEENASFVKTFKKLEQCPDYNTAFMSLETGITDCVAVDIGVANYNLKKNSGKYVMLDEVVSSEKYGIGFKKGNDALKNEVESVLKEMWNDGTIKTIADKYAEYSIPDMLCVDRYVK